MGKILGLASAAIAPPAAAFALLQNWAKAHPWLAVAAFVGYEVLLWSIALIAKVLSGTADELGARWKTRLANWIDQGLLRKLSGFRRRYLRAVLGSLRYIDLKGLATVGFYTPQLDEVFVDVSLVYSDPSAVPAGVIERPQVEPTQPFVGDLIDKPAPAIPVVVERPHVDPTRRFIGDLIDKPEPVVLAVIGAPGCGKTTLLRHTALLICRKRRRKRRIPVLLYLRDHVTAIMNDVPLPDLVHVDAPTGWFSLKLRAGACVVLLDGLDEVADAVTRRLVADWVERQISSYSLNDFVITSRPHGYHSAPIQGAGVVQVRGFSDEQVTRFAHSWYLAFEQRSTGEKNADVSRRAAEEADDLLERLHHNPMLYELTANPLLLTMIANVHKFRGALPGSRVDLYSEICQVLLWRRQEAKKLASELTGDQKMSLLSGLAYTMTRKHVRDFDRTDVLTEFRPFLRRMAPGRTEEDFLAEMTSSGLLVEREHATYSFAHLTFQEFLSAHHIRDKHLAHVLVERIDDVWWRETTLLYVARANADPIVEACLEANTVVALSLAFDCAEQASELAANLRSHLDRLLETVFRSNNAHSPIRRLMVNVVVTRHVRKLVRTIEGTRLNAEPVNAGIYSLFRESYPYRAPDAVPARLDEPVVGVRADDARAFVEWVNDITGSEPGFRLPLISELENSRVARKLGRLQAWTADSQNSAWPKNPDTYRIPAELLYQDIYSDLTKLPEIAAICEQIKIASLGGRFATRLPRPSTLRVLSLSLFTTSGYEDAVGHALFQVIYYSPETPELFRQRFIEVVSRLNEDRTYAVPPDEISALVEKVRKTPMTQWGSRTRFPFIDECLAVFWRRKPLDPMLAAELRLAAMCLSMETDETHRAVFRRIAAGICWLERRAQGKINAAETILLAAN
ncbi:NACHT domain-containing protein [Lentzea sp. NPDC003310]|uniref:NACHT domain-containing protein n=1 Tax=Lentzea sp. NPDC003310 TaxID=3154447 RepID=UPI0033B68899